MATITERARGAAAFVEDDRDPQESIDYGAVHFTHLHAVDEGWDSCIEQIKQFHSLQEDWDGEGSPPPDTEIIAAAISLAQQLERDGLISPDRVVASVNGTIYFEWYSDTTYGALEVYHPRAAEIRNVCR